MDFKQQFITLRKKYIEKRFGSLNDVQRKASLEVNGPLLILAGAGSGKTTVVVNRIRCLLEFGDAYVSNETAREVTENDVKELGIVLDLGTPLPESIRPLMKTGGIKPWNILAITFTNKAAGELKSRICESVGPDGSEVFASTFHSACVRFLRRDADLLGYPKSFTIYDADDSERALKGIYKENGVDERIFPLRSVLGAISRFKDQLLSPSDARERASLPAERRIADIYAIYQGKLKAAGAFDFDDLIYCTVSLLAQFSEIRERYRERFKYIMVDEYQDTSYAQYRLVELLTNERRNLCVVGDDDQSIYRFRGATIENILGFENSFEGAQVVRLEQNYRSTETILNAANEVIAHNAARKGKTLWTDRGVGEPVEVHCASDEADEAAFIARELVKNQAAGIPLNRQAVLYRMNAQSGALENHFMRAGIPYRIVGGQRFFDRAEIKDVLAYMAIVANPADDLRLARIVNRPARKIGDATVSELVRIAAGIGAPVLEVMREAAGYDSLSRAKGALEAFVEMYDKLCEALEAGSLRDFADTLLDITGYRAMLVAQKDEGEARLENVEELLSSIAAFERENPDGDLSLFLEEVALISNVDRYDENADAVALMTLHSAKGLEFDCVFIAGMEEGIFPGERCRFDEREVEEERRLAYVGITRARKKLFLTRTGTRMLFGQTRRNAESRFIGEFSDNLKNVTGESASGGIYRNPTAGRNVRESGAQREYRRANELAKSKIELGSRSSVGKTSIPKSGAVYAAGDEVEHKLFGRGVIVSARALGGDMLLEIDFERAGRKKAMANYAPMKKVGG